MSEHSPATPHGPDRQPPRISRALIFAFAATAGAVVVNIGYEKYAERIPDWLFIVLCLLVLSVWLYWVWTHEKVLKYRQKWIYVYPKMTLIIMIVIGAVVGGSVGGLLWWSGFRKPPSAPLTNAASSTAVAELSKLGWAVVPRSERIQFEVKWQQLPEMARSAAYFRQLNQPFQFYFQGIKNIDGLHELANVSGFDTIEINAGEFSDISELRGLGSLTKLVISQTPINEMTTVDLSSLSGLTNLRELNLFSTKATSLAPIAKLIELRTLNLKEMPIRDLSPLASLHKLESVDVTGTGVTNLSALRNAKNLKELNIGGKQIAGLAALNELANLKKMMIIEQGVLDLSPLGDLPNLEKLVIWGTPLFNLSPLRKLGKLQEVQLSGFGLGLQSVVIDVNALGELKDLKKLTLGEVQITNLSFVSGLKRLTEINMNTIPVSSIAPLRGLTSLERISLHAISVVDISPLLDLPSLTNLSVTRTPARADVLSELERRGVKVQR